MALKAFEDRILTDLLPTFCDDPTRAWGSDGFRRDWERVSEADAEDFLRGIDNGLVKHVKRGQYRAPRSCASEQFFWEGPKSVEPRPITLWIEPIITVAVLARLHFDLGWPKDLLGTQSSDWAFDVTAFLPPHFTNEHIACEVKKTTAELDQLLTLMESFGATPDAEQPAKAKELNAFRKVRALRNRKPPVFWAVGPNRSSYVFDVLYGSNEQVILSPASPNSLVYPDR